MRCLAARRRRLLHPAPRPTDITGQPDPKPIPTLACRPLPAAPHPAPAGCDSVNLAVQPGVAGGPPGAAFLLNITWGAKAGLLLPSGDNAVPALFLGK